jgi:hypothetical protein
MGVEHHLLRLAQVGHREEYATVRQAQVSHLDRLHLSAQLDGLVERRETLFESANGYEVAIDAWFLNMLLS